MPRHRLVLVPLVPLVLISLLASSFAQRNPVSPDDLAPVKGSIGHGQQTAGGPGFVGQSPPPRHGQSGRAATEGMVWQERVFGSRRARHPAAISAIQKVQPTGPIFEAAAVFSTGGNNAESLVTSDFNGDGKLDLVIANQCASGNSDCNGSVAVLLGKGDGSFQSPVSYGSGGNRAFSVVVADVNGDGKPDLIVANGCITDGSFCENGTGGAVGVLLGNGDGTFRPAATFDSGGFGATAVTVRDVNQDGKPDLLVANSCQNIDFCSGTIGVLLGNGDGTFKTAKAYGAGGFYTDAVVVGDVNGDGKLDLIALNRCSEDECLTNGKVGVLLGNGNGTFKTAVSFDVGGLGPLSIAIHDVNGDNKLDLAVAMQCPENGPCGGSAIGVLLGNGDGSFEASVAYGSGGLSASSVGFEDVNRDGKPDLLVANECTISDPACIDGGDLSVLLGNGDGSFAPAITYASGGLNSTSIAAGDVTGDGRFDLLVTNFCNSGNDCTGSVAVLAGNGDGSFAGAAVYQPGGQSIFSLASQDVNGDGNLDLLAALQCSGGDGCTSGYGIGVLLGNSDGTFQSPVVYDSGGIGARSVALSDVNGDGKLDLLVGNECIADDDCTGAVGVLLGNGDGTFQAPMAYASGGQFGTSLKIADVNGDGKSDLLMTNQCADSNCTSSTVGVLLGNGDGTFQTVSTYSSGGYFAVSVNAGDVNGDGKIDLLVANQCAIGSNCATSGNVSVLLGAGGGVFQAPVSYASGGQFPYSVVLGDVNGDGNLDLLVVNQCADSVCENGSLGVLLGNGNGTFQPASSTTLPAFSSASLVLADFNGDGKLDVASSGGLLLMGNGDGTFQVPLALGVTGFGITLGDFNHDGRPDLALGGVVVFLNVSSRGVPTTTSLTSSLNPANFGQAVAFTARVAPIGATTPTGSITFRDGITVLGTMPLSNRHAIFNTSTLPAGSHSITANYSGDGNYLANSSQPLVELRCLQVRCRCRSINRLPIPRLCPASMAAI